MQSREAGDVAAIRGKSAGIRTIDIRNGCKVLAVSYQCCAPVADLLPCRMVVLRLRRRFPHLYYRSMGRPIVKGRSRRFAAPVFLLSSTALQAV